MDTFTKIQGVTNKITQKKYLRRGSQETTIKTAGKNSYTRGRNLENEGRLPGWNGWIVGKTERQINKTKEA